MKPIACVIPAKSNSSRLPRKNLLRLGPFSLVQWAIIHANEAGFRPLVIGDQGWHDEDVAFPHGKFDYLDRDPAWSSPEMSSLELSAWALKSNGRSEDAILLLQPTSPLRSLEDILKCVDIFKKYDVNVTSTDETTDELNGAIYIRKPTLPHSDHGIIYPMPHERSIDINTESDFEEAKSLMARRMSE